MRCDADVRLKTFEGIPHPYDRKKSHLEDPGKRRYQTLLFGQTGGSNYNTLYCKRKLSQE